MIKERIIWLFVLTTALAYALGVGLNRPKDAVFFDKLFWIKKTFDSPVHDIVLIGDSRTYRGIDPATVSNEIKNKSVFNFGYSSGGFTNELIVAGVEKLSSNGSRVVVFCITPYSLTAKACNNEQYKIEIARKKEEILEAKYFSGLTYFFRPTNPQYFLEKRYLLEKAKESDSLFYHQQHYDNGWVASWKLKHEFNETVISYKKEFEGNLPQQKTVNTILSKIKELKKQGYTVIGLRMPVQKELFELEETVSSNLFNELKTGFNNAGGYWIDSPLITNTTYDASHMDKWGAIKFSRFLGREIRKVVK